MGIRTKVIRRPKVEDITIALNIHHVSNGSDGPSPRTTPSLSVDDVNQQLQVPFWFPWTNEISHGPIPGDINDGIGCSFKQTAVAKVSKVSSLLGKAGTTGLGKAIAVLDRLGSSMTNLNSIGFTSGMPMKENRISILAFEVANTIVKSANLMQSLSEDNIRHLKEVVLPSKGVQTLISRDMDELLRIAGADKREELQTLFRDVVRFGNHSKDPMWHNLDRYFMKICSKHTQKKHLKKQAETVMVMAQLMTLVHSTAELCHELHSLDRLEQDYLHILKEDSSNSARTDSLAILRADVRNQRKRVNSLKKKSLWSKTFEEVVQKLVDIVQLLHLKIHEGFGSVDDDEQMDSSQRNHKKLGSAGLSVHYASIITQMNTLVSRSSPVPQKMRDSLYQGLPCSVKSKLRSKLQLVQLTTPQVKAEMEKTLEWLVPICSNTTKFEGCWKHPGQTAILRIETLHHADKEETEACILKLVVWLHHLISQVGAGEGGMPSSPVKTPNQKTNQMKKPNCSSPILTIEDQEMLQDISKNNLRLGTSKSQHYDTGKIRLSKHHRLSQSSRDSLTIKTRKDPFPISLFSRPIDFDIDRIKLLDVIDGVDTTKGSK